MDPRARAAVRGEPAALPRAGRARAAVAGRAARRPDARRQRGAAGRASSRALRRAFPELRARSAGRRRAGRARARAGAAAGGRAAGDRVPGRTRRRDAGVRSASRGRGRAAGERRHGRARAAAACSLDGTRQRAGAVVVAAGPWTPEVIDPAGRWRPIAPLWGVVSEVRLDAPPRHALEEAGVEQLVAGGAEPPPLFSLITAGAVSALGSMFVPERPDAGAGRAAAAERGARFVPALARTASGAVRACARPLSADGRPLLGRAPGHERRLRRRGPRALGDLARPGIGAAGGGPGAGAGSRAAGGLRPGSLPEPG